MLAKLKEVHKNVTRLFTYKTDREKYKKDEHWVIPEEFLQGKEFEGDCEDFAMACRTLIRTLDIESQLVVCYDENKELHCVLHVNGYILDNRQKNVTTTNKLTKLGYTWVAISGNDYGDQWHRVKDGLN